jgi:hypothetical protein
MPNDDRRSAAHRAEQIADVPANVEEFNKIAGLIFAQLYKAFPFIEDIDSHEIARAMEIGGSDADWTAHMLPSGRSFGQVLFHTMNWLIHQGYIEPFGTHDAERVMLMEKGLMAMNATPFGREGQTVGAELKEAVESGAKPDLSRIGDLVGGIFGS